jgi:hypothetical protein
LRWEVVASGGGAVMNAWLVRAPGAAAELPGLDRLPPWSCVVGDLAGPYPQARQQDPQTPAQWLVFVDDDRGHSWRLTFVHGLLQLAASVG